MLPVREDDVLGQLRYVWNTRKLPSRLLRFYRGHRDFRRTGKTSPRAYKSMRQLYVITNGRFNDWMALREARRHPPRPVRAEGPVSRKRRATEAGTPSMARSSLVRIHGSVVGSSTHEISGRREIVS